MPKAAAARFLLASLASAILLVGCSSRPVALPPGRAESTGSEPSGRAFVTVAVDNHFHDIHPTDHRRIRQDQALVVKNQGRNLHNFTVTGTKISRDVGPGEALRWSPIGKVLKPGTYTVLCKYHDWDGMTGAFTVV